jgi:pimeloyl-ACP methyl ester carboxylesterase
MTQNVPHSDVGIAKANGIEIAYETFGDPSAKPMLLIMGLGFQMIVWDDEFCTQLATRGYWVIRFDNRDIGLSTRFDKADVPNIFTLLKSQEQSKAIHVPYTLSDMTDDVIGLLDALGIESAHVVGLSMGGMIGQIMAAKFSERIHTLTSIMSSTGDPGLPPPKSDAISVLLMPLPTERVAYIESCVRVWSVLSGPQFPVDETRVRKWAGQSHDRGLNPAGFARQFAAIIASGSRKEMLKSVTVPTMVFHGDADPLVPVECGIDTANTIPGAKLVIVKGMGHALPEALWPRAIDAIKHHA